MKVPVVDEIGYLPVSRTAAMLSFLGDRPQTGADLHNQHTTDENLDLRRLFEGMDASASVLLWA